MGYSTDFIGEFGMTPTLKPEHRAYLWQFANTRRVKRDPKLTEKRPDPIRLAACLPIGTEGAFFVGAAGAFGQESDALDIVDFNKPPVGQPGHWCPWTPNDAGTAIEWVGGEKFYEYVPWLEYLIRIFLRPWGYRLNGEVVWIGGEPDDRGKIVVKENHIVVLHGTVVYK